MVELGDKLREISTGKIYFVKRIDEQSVVLETLDGSKQIMVGTESLREYGFEEERKNHR